MQIQNLHLMLLFTIVGGLVNYLVFSNLNYISKITGLIDKPDFKRKIHARDTPLVGALPLAILFIIFLSVDLFVNLFDTNVQRILIISLCFFAIGAIDDKINLSSYQKIILLTLVIFFLLPSKSLLIIDKIFFYDTSSFYYLENFSFFFTILCILCLVNAINLSDGINGLAAGIVFLSIFYILILFENNFNNYLIIILMNMAIAIFLIYRGKFFLGDSGSLFLSSFLSLIIIYYINSYWEDSFLKNSWARDIKVGSEHIFIILMIPGFDMLRLFFYRIVKKRDPLSPDNEHLHHYLIKMYGLNKALIFYFTIMNVPIIISLYTELSKQFIIIFFLFIYLIILFFLRKKIKQS